MKQVEYDKALNDSMWHIVYDTVVNDTHLVNEFEWHLCKILNDTSGMNAMNVEWCNIEWFYEYWMIQYWMSKWTMEWYNIEWFNETRMMNEHMNLVWMIIGWMRVE